MFTCHGQHVHVWSTVVCAMYLPSYRLRKGVCCGNSGFVVSVISRFVHGQPTVQSLGTVLLLDESTHPDGVHYIRASLQLTHCPN